MSLSRKPFQLKLTEELESEAEQIAQDSGLSKSHILRQAITAGLVFIRNEGIDSMKTLAQKKIRKKQNPPKP